MSALARYFKHAGMVVAGYDRTSTSLTGSLEKEGISVHFTDSPDVFPEKMNPENSLVVYTPAVPESLNEIRVLRQKGFTIVKRAGVLGMICNHLKCLAVAGTHGKTTLSTMAATIMHNSAIGCNAILGGISRNFNSNLVLSEKAYPWMVTEADEYDRSFLNLNPDIAVVTSVDADHLEIYGSLTSLRDSFEKFVRKVKPGGKVVLKAGLDLQILRNPETEFFTYSLEDNADFYPVELKFGNGPVFSEFSLQTPWGLIPKIQMIYPGYVNVENAVGAASAALLAGVSFDEVKSGLGIFQGVRRRFDLQYSDDLQVYFDDYAHHPKELSAFITSVRKLFPERKITGIFQPHLFSRTKDLSEDFARSLDMLDTAILLPIYPARELPVEGVTSELIFNQMRIRNKFLLSKEEAKRFVLVNRIEVLLTMGAGDIDEMSAGLIEILKNRSV